MHLRTAVPHVVEREELGEAMMGIYASVVAVHHMT
jgi:hypothetical protein